MTDHTTAAGGLRILVADDYRDAACSLVLLLRAHGHESHLAFDGEWALADFERLAPGGHCGAGHVPCPDRQRPCGCGFPRSLTMQAISWRRSAALALLLSSLVLAASGCDRRSADPVRPTTTSSATLPDVVVLSASS